MSRLLSRRTRIKWHRSQALAWPRLIWSSLPKPIRRQRWRIWMKAWSFFKTFTAFRCLTRNKITLTKSGGGPRMTSKSIANLWPTFRRAMKPPRQTKRLAHSKLLLHEKSSSFKCKLCHHQIPKDSLQLSQIKSLTDAWLRCRIFRRWQSKPTSAQTSPATSTVHPQFRTTKQSNLKTKTSPTLLRPSPNQRTITSKLSNLTRICSREQPSRHWSPSHSASIRPRLSAWILSTSTTPSSIRSQVGSQAVKSTGPCLQRAANHQISSSTKASRNSPYHRTPCSRLNKGQSCNSADMNESKCATSRWSLSNMRQSPSRRLCRLARMKKSLYLPSRTQTLTTVRIKGF